MPDPRRPAAERAFRNRYSRRHMGVLRDPNRIDEEGVLGEQVFAEAFGFPVDAVEVRGPTRQNFVLRDGTRVDVRASGHRYPRLIAPPGVAHRTTVDVYVLVEVDRPAGTGTLIGWATADELRAAPVQRISSRPDATPVHVLTPGNLRPIATLRHRHDWHTLELPI